MAVCFKAVNLGIVCALAVGMPGQRASSITAAVSGRVQKERTKFMEEEKSVVAAPKRKKKKLKKRWIVLGVVVLAVVGGSFLLRKKGAGTQAVLASDTTVLSYTDLESSISATGTVESRETTKVYSTLAYQVKNVLVEVGDVVQEGDLLAELDGEPVENQIASQKTSMEVASGSAGAQVQSAYDAYDNFKQTLDSGLNASLIGAQSQVDNAYDAYVKATNAYERYKENVKLGENTQVLSAEASRNNASSALDQAEESYKKAKDARKEAYDVYQPLQQELDAAQKALEQAKNQPEPDETAIAEAQEKVAELTPKVAEAKAAYDAADSQVSSLSNSVSSAQSAYDIAQATYNAALRGEDQALDDYADAVDSAWRAYQTALTSLESTKKGTQDQLESYSDTLASANAGANMAVSEESLRQLNKTLDDTKITAPASGTVTAVYATVGGSGSGLLFVIEDTDHLVVSTSVKGYDLGAVKTGMEVTIKSDATGDTVIPGTLTSIAPTAKKDAMGETQASSDPSFEAEVQVDTTSSGLRIGMEARLSYIVARAERVLAVPYEAVYTDETGASCILAVQEQDDGKLTLVKLPVTTGLDDDLDIAVSGEQIEQGLRVVTEPKSYLSYIGKTIMLTQATGFENMGVYQ